ncbi:MULTISPECIES: hypothetical protein [unclassified Pseudomonas]|uniref:hypothetical protein n=1 Tax=unclassified Pseudomonas TaxID=196821 RepID=UPI0008F2750F|nr:MULTISPECIES: hypothetical protein [unclassified Pseudomonas]SFP86691.1 hypothetical protein SAMN03159315_05049 [Pseudomonas sp. NFPP28]
MNQEPAGEIMPYQRGYATTIDFHLDGETVWLTQEKMAEQPSEVEAAYMEAIKTVQKKITGKKSHESH